MAHGEWPKVTMCPKCKHHAFDYEYVATDPKLGPFTGFGHGFGGEKACKCGCTAKQYLPLESQSADEKDKILKLALSTLRMIKDKEGTVSPSGLASSVLAAAESMWIHE